MLTAHRRFARQYIREVMRQLRDHHNLRLIDVIKYYPSWFSAINRHASPVTDRIPWITFRAIDYLDRHLRSDMTVFEYGIGGSTLFFLDRVRHVVSVEHNAQWVRNVAAHLTDNEAGRWNCHVVEPEDSDDRVSLSDPADFRSESSDYSEKTFRGYVLSIDEYPDDYFDVIMIDGRARPSCFLHSLEKVKIGGYIFWDNTERDYYHETMRLAPPTLEVSHFPGPAPFIDYFTRTTAWFRGDSAVMRSGKFREEN